MEWVLILIGIAYSLWSSYQKDAKAREQKLRGPGTVDRDTGHGARGPGSAERGAGAAAHASGRRTLSRSQPARDINVVHAAKSYGLDVTEVREVSVDDFQEDFTSRLNRKLKEQGLQTESRRSSFEDNSDFAKPMAERTLNYDKRTTYDERTTYNDRTAHDNRATYDDRALPRSTEHDYDSHFKLNVGLRKHGVRVSGTDVFDELDIEEAAELVRSNRRLFTLDRKSLQSYVIMHEVLGKPRSLRLLGRKR